MFKLVNITHNKLTISKFLMKTVSYFTIESVISNVKKCVRYVKVYEKYLKEKDLKEHCAIGKKNSIPFQIEWNKKCISPRDDKQNTFHSVKNKIIFFYSHMYIYIYNRKNLRKNM